MDQITYPQPEDIPRLSEQIPTWGISSKDFLTEHEDFRLEDFFGPFEISSWVGMIGHRLKEADYSFVMASFYLEKGIPDEEWYRSTDNGISYFPNFNDDHNRNKFAFEYFSDVYFYKAFSALDAMAHLMTQTLGLTWGKNDKIYFPKAVNKIEQIRPELYADLKVIMDSPEYIKINRLRNDTTHNFSDGHVDSGVIKEENKIALTVGNYMTVQEKHLLMQWMCKNLIQMINLIKLKWKSN